MLPKTDKTKVKPKLVNRPLKDKNGQQQKSGVNPLCFTSDNDGGEGGDP